MTDYDLTLSKKAIGVLYPILRDAHGNIIDGFHRENADPDWPSITINLIDDPVKLELARLTANGLRRTVPFSETQRRIGFLIAEGGLTPEQISEKTGMSIDTVYKYMPQDMKDPVKVAARLGKGSVRSSEQTVTTSDTPKQTEPIKVPASADFPKCDRCRLPTHISKLKAITLDVCPQCYEELIHKKARP